MSPRRTQLGPSLAVLGLLALSCGDGVVGQGYRGTPLFSFAGRIDSTTPGADVESDLQVAIFWTSGDDVAVDDELMIEHPAVSITLRFPGIFEANIFGRPPDGTTNVDWPDLRMGLILAYADENRDGRFQQEELRGGAENHVLLYADRAIPAERSPTRRAIAPGYRVERLPLPCDEPILPEPRRCGVPLGAPCVAHDDCGAGGLCYRGDAGGVWPGGLCTEYVNQTCRPGGVVEAVVRADGREHRVWMPTCDSQVQCRTGEGYECDEVSFTLEARAVCRPDDPLILRIRPDMVLADLCPEGFELDGPLGEPEPDP